MFPTCKNSQKQVKNQKSANKLIQEDIDLSDIYLAVLQTLFPTFKNICGAQIQHNPWKGGSNEIGDFKANFSRGNPTSLEERIHLTLLLLTMVC